MQQAAHDVPSTPAGVKARASREAGGPVKWVEPSQVGRQKNRFKDPGGTVWITLGGVSQGRGREIEAISEQH